MAASSAVLLLGKHIEQLRFRRNTDNSTSYEISNETTVLLNVTGITNVNKTLAHTYMLKMEEQVILMLHTLIFMLALIGNGLVITTLIQNTRMRTITNIFLLNLAISDLLLAIVCMPFTVIPVILQNFMFGETMCILIRYLQGVTVSASAFTLVAISLERFYAICNPLKSRKWQNMRHSYKVIGGIWVAAMILNIPMAAFQHLAVDPRSTSKQCTDKWPDETAKKVYYVVHLLIADLLVPLLIMSVAYGLIARQLWNGVKTMNVIEKQDKSAVKPKRHQSLTSEASENSEESEVPLTAIITPPSPCVSPTESQTKFNYTLTAYQSPFGKSKRQSISRQGTENSMRSHTSKQAIDSKKRVIKMLFVIVIEFFVCWTPLYLVYLWFVLDEVSARKNIRTPKYTLSMLRLLAYISSCCNPITYCFMSKKFRQAFLTAFRCRKELQRKATYMNTQVSYCTDNNHANTRGKLSLPVLNGHNKPHLPILHEASSDNEAKAI